MMMPSTMILTICILMMLKRHRGLSLDIGSRLAGSGLAGSKATPRQKFSVTSVVLIFNQWGVKPPNPSDKSNAAVAAAVFVVCFVPMQFK